MFDFSKKKKMCCARMVEWSKTHRLRRCSYRSAGSNPASRIFFTTLVGRYSSGVEHHTCNVGGGGIVHFFAFVAQ